MAKLKVIDDLCISCGACQAISEDLFIISEETGLAEVKVEEVPAELMEVAEDAVSGCPTNAIVLE